MSARFKAALLIASVNVAAACHSSPAEPAARIDLAVETDKAEYSLAADTRALVRLTNNSTTNVYLPMYTYVVCERLRDGEWRDAIEWFVVDGIGRAMPVEPGGGTTNELPLKYLGATQGSYRFRYLVYADANAKSLAPIEERVSAPFVVSS